MIALRYGSLDASLLSHKTKIESHNSCARSKRELVATYVR